MITIRLYGHLGKKFGRLHRLAVKSPIEAIKALEANFKGFKLALLDKNIMGYKIICDKQDRSKPELLQYPVDNELKIIPVIHGKGNGWANIIIAVVIIIIEVILQQYEWMPGTWQAYLATEGATAVYMFAASQMMIGISALLYKPPKPKTMSAENAELKSAYQFNGPPKLSRQGTPVPLAYGKVLIGSVVVHGSITTVEG